MSGSTESERASDPEARELELFERSLRLEMDADEAVLFCRWWRAVDELARVEEELLTLIGDTAEDDELIETFE